MKFVAAVSKGIISIGAAIFGLALLAVLFLVLVVNIVASAFS